MIPRGVRARLIVTVIGLVALTSLVLGVGAYAYVATSLRDQQRHSATDLTNYNVGVLAADPTRLPANATPGDLVASHLLEGFEARGIAGTIVDFGRGPAFTSNILAAGAVAAGQPSAELRSVVATGNVGYERATVGGHPYLVTGARRPPGGPDFYFLFDSGEIDAAIDRLGQALLVGGLALAAVAALAGGAVARRLLRPVKSAAGAAERIAAGDLSARLAVDSRDEFGAWAVSFNHMAAALEEKVGQLQAAQARERRFVADVSHELRTPLTALVTEASLLRDQLDALPPGGRRVGELLVGDIGRLRILVDDLIEISRFDAAAEELQPDELDLAAFVRSVVAARAPDAELRLPAGRPVVVTDRRRLERILGNLLDNARLHGEGREVRVEVRIDSGLEPAAGAGAEGAQLVIVVADRGPGVRASELSHLFDRFHKADLSRHLGGSGLGLAIAREHARLLGGSLQAALRKGGGMQFELRIPVTGSLPAGDETVIVASEASPQVKSITESTP